MRSGVLWRARNLSPRERSSMAGAIDWGLLTKQLGDWRHEVWSLVESPEFEPTRKEFIPRPDFKALPREAGDAVNFMRGLMDECTHLGNYSKPLDPDLVEMVVARYDAYQPRRGITPLHEVLQCRKPREVPEGHVRAYLLHQEVFRKAIYDALDRAASKYPNTTLGQPF